MNIGLDKEHKHHCYTSPNFMYMIEFTPTDIEILKKIDDIDGGVEPKTMDVLVKRFTGNYPRKWQGILADKIDELIKKGYMQQEILNGGRIFSVTDAGRTYIALQEQQHHQTINKSIEKEMIEEIQNKNIIAEYKNRHRAKLGITISIMVGALTIFIIFYDRPAIVNKLSTLFELIVHKVRAF